MMKKQDVQKIDEALALLSEAAKDQKDEITDLISKKYENLKNTVMGVESKVENQVHEGVEHLKEIKDAASEHAKSAANQIDRHVHEDPWKTLGWTVLGALVVGVLIGRRD
jgi:ElaB/YqjD/DUF883 family membrane-anchored ribosome-binding protein